MTRANSSSLLRRALAWLSVLVALTCADEAWAYRPYLERLPTDAVGCVTCHQTSLGGGDCPSPPCLNPFGLAVKSSLDDTGQIWSAELAGADHDRDGYSSGIELGDVDGDQRIDLALTPRSPGIAEGDHGADLDECALELDDCVAGASCSDQQSGPAGRPSFSCSCPDHLGGDGRAGGSGCRPGDTRESARFIADGVWYDFTTAFAFARIREAECGTYTRSMYFRPIHDCYGTRDRMRIEVEGTAALILAGTRWTGEAQIHACTSESFLDVVDPATDWIQIATDGAGQGRIRASCQPNSTAPPEAADANPWTAPTCDYAFPASDALTPFLVSYAVSEAPVACDTKRVGDVYFAYDATCSGTVRVGYEPLAAHVPRGSDSTPVELKLAAYTSADCHARETPLACVSAPGALCSGLPCWTTEGFPDARFAIPAHAGERLYFAVGSDGSPDGNLSIECDGADHEGWCAALCDDEASCAPGGAACACEARFVPGLCRTAACECPAGAEVVRECEELGPGCDCMAAGRGDGVRAERGGTGCNWEQVCELYDIDCGAHGRCAPHDSGASCACDPGYESVGPGCRLQNECATNPCGDPATTGTVCVERDDGYDCLCRPGYSADLNADSLRCQLHCGDGLRGPGEACDDGNEVGGDGCDTSCTVEPLYRCFDRNQTSYCLNGCGDGLIDVGAGEVCDDGNTLSGDGCSRTCRLELSVICSASPGSAAGWSAAWPGLALALGLLLRRARRQG